VFAKFTEGSTSKGLAGELWSELISSTIDAVDADEP
jgi:hypothetical protein